jgi:chemotaxis protein MotB
MGAMNKETWLIAGGLSLLVIIGFLGLTAWQTGQELKQAQAQLSAQRAVAEATRDQTANLQTELAAARARLDESLAGLEELKKSAAAQAQAQRSLEEEMRRALESKDVTISELQGKLTVSILDRILFDSGEAVLKPEGEKILVQVAGVLSQYPKRQIHVVGHTDNVPIRASARSRFASNWELSTARATAAVRFLQEQASVDPRRLGAVGYGEFHPVADNDTPEGRARNRRIAIVVLPEELAATETPPAGPAGDRPAPEIVKPTDDCRGTE